VLTDKQAHKRTLDPVMLSPRGQAVLEAKILGQNFVLGLGLGLEDLSLASDSASSILSSACPRTFYFGLVKKCVMLELVILTHNYQFHYVFAIMVVFN